MVYVGSLEGYLYAIDPDGVLKWKYKTEGPIRSSPTLGMDGAIYFGSDDGHLYVVNPNGSLKWKYKTEGSVESSPAIWADDIIYVGSDDKHLYAFNPDGTLKWKFRYGSIIRSNIYSSPVIGVDGIVLWEAMMLAFMQLIQMEP